METVRMLIFLTIFTQVKGIREGIGGRIPGIINEESSSVQSENEISALHLQMEAEKLKEFEDGRQRDDHETSTRPPSPDYQNLHSGLLQIVREESKSKLKIYCYEGEKKSLATFFKTVQMKIDLKSENYFHYEGSNATAVKQQHSEASWFSFYPWKQKTFKLDLYKKSCVGIDTKEPYKVSCQVRWLDFWRLVYLASGVLLFFAAEKLAQNTFFHFTTGVSLGIIGSLLVIVYIVAKRVPTKFGAATLLVGGWGMVVYIFQYLGQNISSILKEYQNVVIGYIILAGLISFAIVYRYGPLNDRRSINLVKWSMQSVALVAIFLSSHYREATLGINIVIFTYHNIPSKVKAKAATIWRRRFPPKVRLLTEEEYIQQGTEETRKALKDLRKYCHSPECNAWKMMSKLQTPQRYVEFVAKHPYKNRRRTRQTEQKERFAEFVEGKSHLDDSEILAYESNNFDSDSEVEGLLTTDSDSETQS
ncbi:nuclear envelope integral membrane protein-like isoform X2 [Oratosquilla oratoria]|uniref:nuclear envelope integral membrane protein-like isoform X2 n=1 Tax=Oratosquilla oratoria TaxID=337810 RepID=UPI003F76B10B